MRYCLVQQKKSPYWIAKIDYKDPKTHKNKSTMKSTGVPLAGNNKRKANQKAKELLTELSYLETCLSPEILFNDFVDLWYQDYIALHNMDNADESMHERGRGTLQSYRQYIESHIKPFFKGVLLKDINTKALQKYADAKLRKGGSLRGGKLCANSVHKHFAVLSPVMKLARKEGLAEYNYAEDVHMPPKKMKEIDPCSAEDMQIITASLAGKSAYIRAIVLLACLGLRRSEICGLKFSNIDFDKGKFKICFTVIQIYGEVIEQARTKCSSSKRPMKMDNALVAALRDLQAEKEENKKFFGKGYTQNDFVFCTPTGQRLNPDKIGSDFIKYIKSLPLEKGTTMHGLRHAVATILYESGEFGNRELQEFFGWSDEKMLQVYVHVSEQRTNDMANSLMSIIAPQTETGEQVI